MWQFNYGEWTEAYVFLRLLGGGRVYGADKDFNKNEKVYLDVVEITRHENNDILVFKRNDSKDGADAFKNGAIFRFMAYAELISQATSLFDAMKGVTSRDRKFAVESTEVYLKELCFSQPKAPKLPDEVAEEYGKKADIIMKTKDHIDQSISTIGFSIKSHLGAASTLFNSAPASGMIYEIEGCTDDIMYEINGNQISSETGMIDFIKSHPSIGLKFVGTSDDFAANLQLIDLQMVEVLSCIVLIQIGYYERADSSKVKDLVKKVEELNPIKEVKRPESWYKAKVKQFLYDAFAGMTATNAWNGEKQLSGGYIDVSTAGEILFYRAVSDEVFNTYLYEHTFIDRPSRGINKSIANIEAKAYFEGRSATAEEIRAVSYGSNGKKKPKKGDWGYVYKNDGRYYININFQVRFL